MYLANKRYSDVTSKPRRSVPSFLCLLFDNVFCRYHLKTHLKVCLKRKTKPNIIPFPAFITYPLIRTTFTRETHRSFRNCPDVAGVRWRCTVVIIIKLISSNQLTTIQTNQNCQHLYGTLSQFHKINLMVC